MRLVTAAVPLPAFDAVIPPMRPAACRMPSKAGWPAMPHVTRRVADGVIDCALCGALWTEVPGARPPFLVLRLVELEWRRIATERRSAIAAHAVRPFLEWFDFRAFVDGARVLLARFRRAIGGWR